MELWGGEEALEELEGKRKKSVSYPETEVSHERKTGVTSTAENWKLTWGENW